MSLNTSESLPLLPTTMSTTTTTKKSSYVINCDIDTSRQRPVLRPSAVVPPEMISSRSVVDCGMNDDDDHSAYHKAEAYEEMQKVAHHDDEVEPEELFGSSKMMMELIQQEKLRKQKKKQRNNRGGSHRNNRHHTKQILFEASTIDEEEGGGGGGTRGGGGGMTIDDEWMAKLAEEGIFLDSSDDDDDDKDKEEDKAPSKKEYENELKKWMSNDDDETTPSTAEESYGYGYDEEEASSPIKRRGRRNKQQQRRRGSVDGGHGHRLTEDVLMDRMNKMYQAVGGGGGGGTATPDQYLKKIKTNFLEDAKSLAEGTIPQSIVLAIVIGVVCGIACAIYYKLLFTALEFFWKTLPERYVIDHWEEDYYWCWIPLVSFVMITLVGLTVTFMGEPGDLPCTISRVHAEAYIPVHYVAPMAFASLFSILAGGSLGPEAPLVKICGALGGYVSRNIFHQTSTNVVRKHTFMGMAGALAAFFWCAVGWFTLCVGGLQPIRYRIF